MTTRSAERLQTYQTVWTVRPLRARRGPWRAVATLVAALVVGTLLNAEPLQRTASSQTAGWQRDLALAVMDPVVEVSRTLRLTVPRRWLDGLVGAEEAAPTPSPTLAPSPSVSPSPTEAPSEWQARRVATVDDPATLLVTGDSLTESLGPALVNLTLATGVVEPDHETQYSSGLTRPDFYDWPQKLRATLAGHVDIVVFMVGANDVQAIQIGDRWEPYGTDAWFVEYRARADAMAATLSEVVRTAYWVGQPISRSEDFRTKMAAFNEIHRTATEAFDDVRYVSSWELFVDSNGEYADYLPDVDGQLVRVRRTDGIHLTPTGGEWLAAEVLRVIELDWDLARGSSS